jgi:hypothetical protein
VPLNGAPAKDCSGGSQSRVSWSDCDSDDEFVEAPKRGGAGKAAMARKSSGGGKPVRQPIVALSAPGSTCDSRESPSAPLQTFSFPCSKPPHRPCQRPLRRRLPPPPTPAACSAGRT